MPTKLSIWDIIALQEYFANKKKPTAEDKARAKKLDEHLARIVDLTVWFVSEPKPL